VNAAKGVEHGGLLGQAHASDLGLVNAAKGRPREVAPVSSFCKMEERYQKSPTHFSDGL
jgi:hypothetical protein